MIKSEDGVKHVDDCEILSTYTIVPYDKSEDGVKHVDDCEILSYCDY